MAQEILKELPVDVVGNVILSFLSMNDLMEFAITCKNYHAMVHELYFYHIKPRIVNDSVTYPQELSTLLNGEQMWNLYCMFHQLSFVADSYWFKVRLCPEIDETTYDKTHIMNPLLWYITNMESNRRIGLFKHSQSSYYTKIGLYNNLHFRFGGISPNTCYGKINLSTIPKTIDTIVINMDKQDDVIYYFNDYDGNCDEKKSIESEVEYKTEEKSDDNDDNMEQYTYLWKNILIGGGRFVDDTLDCKDTAKHFKIMDEKLINGFDDLVHKMDYQCIHLGFYKNKLKHIKNIDKLHPFVANLEITNQWNWKQSLKSINLTKYQRLTQLNLSGNDLYGDINDLALCLPKCLQVLNLNNNENINGSLDFKVLFHDNELKQIEQVVVTNCNLNGIQNFNDYLPKTLKILCLNYNNIDIDWNKEFKLINPEIRKESCLERLSLCNNKINGYIDFREMREWLPYNLYLIDLNNNNLKGNINLNDYPVGLEEFDISDNNIQQIIGLDLIQQDAERFAGFTYNLEEQYGADGSDGNDGDD